MAEGFPVEFCKPISIHKRISRKNTMKHWSQCRSLDTVEHSCPFSVCTTKLVNLSSSAYATGPPKTCPLFCAKASEASFAFLLLYNSAHVLVADELVIRFSVWSLEKKLVCLNLTPSISEGKQLSIHFAVLCLGPGEGGRVHKGH